MFNFIGNTKIIGICGALVFAGLMDAHMALAQETNGSGALLKRKTPEQVILEKLKKGGPGMDFGMPRPSPIKGLYQVRMPGGHVIYVTPEGDKFIAGEIYAVNEDSFAPIEDPYLIEERKKAISTINPKETIIFKPTGETKAVVYVFTDVDCGYCRRLHSQMHTYDDNGVKMPGYNDLGIEIRYLAFPRAGIPSPSADKLVSAWCSKDKQNAITRLKNELPVPAAVCDNPVAKDYDMGQRVGVSGTPALFFPDGRLIPGYLPPAKLAETLGI